MQKIIVTLVAIIVFLGAGTTAEAAKPTNWRYTEITYEVHENETLEDIAKVYIAKNTYAERELKEFMSGIVEMNDWLLERDVHAGDKLRIAYWEKI